MRVSYNLMDFIKMYYLDSNIPMYLFDGETCIFCMPEQTDLTYPPKEYLEKLLDSKKGFLTALQNMVSFFVP